MLLASEYVVLAQAAGITADPTLFWMAAIAGLGGFTGWLLRDYIGYLKAEAASWRALAYKGANVAEKAVEKS